MTREEIRAKREELEAQQEIAEKATERAQNEEASLAYQLKVLERSCEHPERADLQNSKHWKACPDCGVVYRVPGDNERQG